MEALGGAYRTNGLLAIPGAGGVAGSSVLRLDPGATSGVNTRTPLIDSGAERLSPAVDGVWQP